MPPRATQVRALNGHTASQRFSDPFFGELLAELEDEAAAIGYELQLSAPLASEEPVASYERAILAKRVDGFVVLRVAVSDPRVEHLARSGTPFVTFGVTQQAAGHASVGDSMDCFRPVIDDRTASQPAAAGGQWTASRRWTLRSSPQNWSFADRRRPLVRK